MWKQSIKQQIIDRIPNLGEESNSNLLNHYIDVAFRRIIKYSREDKYNTDYDDDLIEIVARLYNYSGIEGSISRYSGGISDKYDNTDPVGSYLATSSIVQKIKPIGYKYPSTRFDEPK